MLQNLKHFEHQHESQRSCLKEMLIEAFQIMDFWIGDAQMVSIMQIFQIFKKLKIGNTSGLKHFSKGILNLSILVCIGIGLTHLLEVAAHLQGALW